jgi:hypothetical protein
MGAVAVLGGIWEIIFLRQILLGLVPGLWLPARASRQALLRGA